MLNSADDKGDQTNNKKMYFLWKKDSFIEWTLINERCAPIENSSETSRDKNCLT